MIHVVALLCLGGLALTVLSQKKPAIIAHRYASPLHSTFSNILHRLLYCYSSGFICGVLIRGSPCALPEETLEGYEKAARDGADYLELDVVRLSALRRALFSYCISLPVRSEPLTPSVLQVSTADGVLICRHDLTLDDSTDIAEHGFADRRCQIWAISAASLVLLLPPSLLERVTHQCAELG